jgi:transcription elongation GreA/GreB family factor
MKKEIINEIIKILDEQYRIASSAYQDALSISQNADLKSDGKYDTRAIEAGYLTSAQKTRLDEITLQLSLMKKMTPHKSESIQVGSFFKIKYNDKESSYFVTALTGGFKIQLNEQRIHIISTKSPLWDSISGLKVNEEFEYPNQEDSEAVILKIQ